MTYRVLAYHAVGDYPELPPAGVAISPDAFAAHLDWVLASGWTTVPLSSIVSRLAAGLPPQAGEVAFTFDDGYADWPVRVAGPLADRRIPATFFVSAGVVGRSFAHGPASLPAISAADVSSLARAPGFEVGSHGVTHSSLTGLAADELDHELAGSRHRLEDLCQRPVRYLAYPYGAFDARVRQAARRAGYQEAFTVWTREEGPFARLRIPIHGRDGVLVLRLKLSPLYFPVKAVLRA